MGTKLTFISCACIRAGHCHAQDGSVGHLLARIGNRVFFLRRCSVCGERPGEHDPLVGIRRAGW